MTKRERISLGLNGKMSSSIGNQVGYDLLNHLYTKLYKDLNYNVAIKLRSYLYEKSQK